MAIIVRHKEHHQSFILLGTGFGAFQSAKSHWFFGHLGADRAEGMYPMVCVCNEKGQIGWFDSEDLVVESIDGQPVAEAFGT